MKCNNVEIVQPLEDILDKLRFELHTEGIKLLEKEPRKSGHNIQCQCPYHKLGKERKLSFGIDVDTGVGHCFACDTVVQLDEFISNCFGHNDSGAYGWSWLLQNFIYLEEEDRHYEINNSRNSNSSDDSLDTENYVSEEELDKYRYYHSYWEKRGITSEELIEQFDLGYDKKTACITMPDFDIDGNCLFVARRSVHYKFFQYPKNVKKNCYGIYQLYHLEEFPKQVWIVESMIDCLRLWQLGKFAVALNGLGNQQQYQELKDMPCRSFVLSTDMDKAGQDARDKLYFKLRNKKILYEVFLPEGRKDIGECTDAEILELKPQLL